MKSIVVAGLLFFAMGVSNSFALTRVSLKCSPDADIDWALSKTIIIKIEINSKGEMLKGEIDGIKVVNSSDLLYLPNRDWYYSFEPRDLKKLRLNQLINMTIIGEDYLAAFNVDVPCRRIK